jgi:hypothetical protein
MSDRPKPDAGEFVNGHRYTTDAGELIANCIVIYEPARWPSHSRGAHPIG